MKRVIIKQLSLKNFKGFKSFEVIFKDKETTVIGANGTGKSTIFDAFCWLLFGKDAQDRKDYEIKHLINGVSIPKTEVEVIGVLDIDGETITLKRQFTEKWQKPKGSADEVFKGNETTTFYNDVPVNVSDYQKRINEIINETVFKMVTNPLFFANMPWEKQREQLFQIAGALTDDQIAEKDDRYKALLDQISGKSIADFRREIAAKKTKANDSLKEIQPKIDQTVKLMPEAKNYSIVEQEFTALYKQLTEIDKAVNDRAEAVRQQYEAVRAKQQEANNLKTRRQQLIYDAEAREKEAAHEANAAIRSLQSAISEAETELRLSQSQLNAAEKELEFSNQRRDDLNKYVIDLRKEWADVNSKEYDGSDICSACGQELPEKDRSYARQHFTDHKTEKLAKIADRGNGLKNEVEVITQVIGKSTKSVETLRSEVAEKEVALSSLKEQFSKMELATPKPIVPEEVPKYLELTKRISLLEEEVNSAQSGAKQDDTEELRSRKAVIMEQIEVKKNILREREMIEKHMKEIDDLEKQGKVLSQQIADLENTEFVMKSFTKTRIDESESRINGLFQMVTFRLFEFTIQDREKKDPVEVCVPLVDGVPFPTVNTAGQTNAGLDIINALSKHYGVCAPIFIDRRESIGSLIETESQIINLVFVKDEQLTIK